MAAPDNNKTPTGQVQAEAAAKQSENEAAAAAAAAEQAKREQEAAKVAADEAAAKAKQAEKDAADTAATAKKVVKLIQLRITIRRDEQTTVPVYAFEHELPVLNAMHGEDNVKVIERDTIEYAGFNPASELQRLKRKYRDRDGSTKSVDLSYRSASELANAAGVRYAGEEAAKPKRSQVTKGKKRVVGGK
jgi:hypothetical protein